MSLYDSSRNDRSFESFARATRPRFYSRVGTPPQSFCTDHAFSLVTARAKSPPFDIAAVLSLMFAEVHGIHTKAIVCSRLSRLPRSSDWVWALLVRLSYTCLLSGFRRLISCLVICCDCTGSVRRRSSSIERGTRVRPPAQLRTLGLSSVRTAQRSWCLSTPWLPSVVCFHGPIERSASHRPRVFRGTRWSINGEERSVDATPPLSPSFFPHNSQSHNRDG